MEVKLRKGSLYMAIVMSNDGFKKYDKNIEYSVFIQPFIDIKYDRKKQVVLKEDVRVCMYNRSPKGDALYIVMKDKEHLLENFNIIDINELTRER